MIFFKQAKYLNNNPRSKRLHKYAKNGIFGDLSVILFKKTVFLP